MAGSSLAVPIDVDVLIANDGVVAQFQSLRWWIFDYGALATFDSAEPLALDEQAGTLTPGVYVHWTLPGALRRGSRNARNGAVEYPLVPNRWLVVRSSASVPANVAAWVVESDCPSPPDSDGFNAVYLVDPALAQMWRRSPDASRNGFALGPSTVPTTLIGARSPLSKWAERDANAMFLTAVAPGNPNFAAYVPHHAGVFALYDPLEGIDDDTLSYTVVGWYSDPSRDIIAAGTGTAGLLDGMHWVLPGGTTETAARSVYGGGAYGVRWQRAGASPTPDPLQDVAVGRTLNVALGNTTIDAFTTLVAPGVGDPAASALLRAFNYDLLPVLNDVNGDALLDERIRREWFGSIAGSRSWAIVENSSDGTVAAALTADEAAWLRQLNVDQAALDDALGDLFADQWRLNELWYKAGYLSDPDHTDPLPSGLPASLDEVQAQLAAAVDPGVAGSVAAQVVAQLENVKQLLAKVPAPDWTQTKNRQQAFLNGVAAFAAGKALDAGKTLKAVAAPRFWRANNPVVAISGVTSPYEPDPDASLAVRLIGGATSSASLPALGLSQVPDAVGPLLDELLTAASPAWSQPWAPLFMDWSAQFVPLAQNDQGTNWTFDGTEYAFTGAGSAPDPIVVSGVSLLSPHAQLVFGSRLRAFLNTFASKASETKSARELSDLWDQIESVYGWNFLAQELVGFNEMLALRDVRAFRRPMPSETTGSGSGQRRLADLIGFDDNDDAGDDALPDAYRGRVGTVPLIPNGAPLPFSPIRQGQLWLSDLVLYDRFGRTLTLISSDSSSGLTDQKNFPTLLDAALQPQTSVHPEVKAVAELPPRPMQHARLDVQLLDKADDTHLLGLDDGVCPVCAWVVPNHLDRSILLYAPDGTGLGELRLTTDGVERRATWAMPPHGSVRTVDDLRSVSPHLHDFVTSPALATEAAFTAFLGAIDETLWTIDPLGGRADQNLSVLIGRPLALVRARLQLQLEGKPIRDTGWAATFDTDPPAFLTQRFAIRLGDQATRTDGTIGYFSGTNYDTFNSVVAPDPNIAQTYVTQIGPLGGGKNYLRLPFADATYAYVTLLADPRASVHAVTGIVPVTEIRVPAAFVEPPLARMEVGFRMGPILTALRATPAPPGITPHYDTSIVYPLPAEDGGTWSWWERTASGDDWTGYDLLAATTTARLAGGASLRDGIFQLEIDLEKHQ